MKKSTIHCFHIVSRRPLLFKPQPKPVSVSET